MLDTGAILLTRIFRPEVILYQQLVKMWKPLVSISKDRKIQIKESTNRNSFRIGHLSVAYDFITALSGSQIKSSTLPVVVDLPRWILAFFNIALAAKIFGRYSIMVLAK
jgi:hypothetical protein